VSACGRGATYRTRGAYYTPPALALAIVSLFVEEWQGLDFLEPSAGGAAFVYPLYRLGLVGERGNLEVMDLNPEARALRMPGPHLRTVAVDTGDPVRTGFLVTDPKRGPDVIIGNPPFGVPRPDEACPRCKGLTRVQVTARQRKLLQQGYLVGGFAPCPRCKGRGVVSFDRPIPVAQLHVERALEVSRRWVVQLMRLAMVESVERLDMWRDAPLRTTYILPRRPDFMRVCPACCGTRVEVVPGGHLSLPCSTCDGSGELAHGGSGDSAAYGVFVFDHQYDGRPGMEWLDW
jgi:hypothetical protein